MSESNSWDEDGGAGGRGAGSTDHWGWVESMVSSRVRKMRRIEVVARRRVKVVSLCVDGTAKMM